MKNLTIALLALFMYGDVVSFQDDFYGFCTGKVIDRTGNTAENYEYGIDAKCANMDQRIELWKSAKELTHRVVRK